MDGDREGVADKTVDAIESWPPGLPVFGLLTPYPATPLYDRLEAQGRLTRPKHWLDFRPFEMAFTPENMSISAAEAEVNRAWSRCYEPQAIQAAVDKISHRPFKERAAMLVTRMAFRGIYFPQMTWKHWARSVYQNRRVISSLLGEGISLAWKARRQRSGPPSHRGSVKGGRVTVAASDSPSPK